ncbi:XRE family transcriptional regulator [Helicobacter anatolicus]|uniref:XRE family transcriptional regulator n=1 Tax=Helicobacter anatolicus TaxID=2905874 RepID=UPI001E4F19B5|nr:XRE family transcriptional regulator [Helicobacter anatolicus]MCE3037775.1 XRE family transcriptional regulator [Helicobacter anatolicus]
MQDYINKDEFLKLLKLANLNKKQLAEISGIPYATINNWGYRTPYPIFVRFMLENYIKTKACNIDDEIIIKAKKYDELMLFLKEQNEKS